MKWSPLKTILLLTALFCALAATNYPALAQQSTLDMSGINIAVQVRDVVRDENG
jgi:hypothetical protein